MDVDNTDQINNILNNIGTAEFYYFNGRDYSRIPPHVYIAIWTHTNAVPTTTTMKDVVVTMKKDVFDSLENICIDVETDCVICQSAIPPGEITKKIPCNHKFHMECIEQLLLNYSVKCPSCRLEIASDEDKVFL